MNAPAGPAVDRATADAEPFAVPPIVGGRFEIRHLLGAGGEAEVYLGHDLELGLDVVLKTRRVVDGDDLARLRREAATLMQIVAHRGLPLVRSDLVDGDRYYMISDHVDGNDIHAVVSAQGGGGLPLPTVLSLIDQVATTLDHLHAHQPSVVHGDVKPENLVVTGEGRAVLIDFGTAMRVGDDRERLGTPGFSAPEVLAGDALTASADVYSLAALSVYLLTGVVPKLGSSWLAALAEAGLVRLERVIRSGLTWDPAGRPWAAADFAKHLRDAAEMDIPTGTVTLALFEHADGPGPLLGILEAAGGRHAASVTLPSGRSVVVFSRAGDAAAAAIDAVASSGVSIALHAGDLGGWHGATLQQLADECVDVIATAPPATVVGSPPVRMLLGAGASYAFEPITATSVRIDRASATNAAPARPDGPATLPGIDRAAAWIAGRRGRPLAGRTDELRLGLDEIAAGRSAGRAPLLIVLGEAGMGKTRFVAEVASRAAASGDAVFVGRCSEAGGAFEPFLDALGDDSFAFESGQLERDEEGWIDRRRFFGRIADALRALERPVTLVLDDVQWIDGSSLALLAQLLDDLGASLAIIASSRPTAQSPVLDELTLQHASKVISMGPLTVADVAEIAEASGLSLSADTVEGLHTLTGGSPFFGLQLLSHLHELPGHAGRVDEDGATEFGNVDLPAGVREWILQRVDRLGERARDTLAPAAVAGMEFDVVALADVLGVSPLELLAHLDAAATAGLLVDGEHPGAFRFVHSIVRATLEESLSSTRRALLHAATARRLEEDGTDVDTLESALHHWLAAEHLGDPLHAGAIAAEVATRATERLAHERAISILDRALEVLGGAPVTAERDSVEARLRVAHGRADFVATRNADAIAQLYRAADLAESGDDPATLAEAALVASLNRRHGLDDPELLVLLERASERCPPEPAVLPAMLHVRRSRLLPLSVRHEERSAMSRLALADLELMDPVDRATVETEVARACWCPDDAAARLAVATRVVDAAAIHLESGGPSRWTGVLLEALNLRWATRVQLGDVTGALLDADHAAMVADEAGTTFLLSRVMMGQSMIHATLGHHERAEQLSRDSVAMSDRHNLVLVQMAIAYSIGRDRGQQAELSKLEQQLQDLVEINPLLIAAFALVHAEAGQLDDARRLLGALLDAAPWPRNWLWLAITTAALETAVITEDHDMSRRLTAVLSRYSGQWAVAAAEVACWGPVDRVLGLAHLAAGRTEQGRALIRAALDASRAQGADAWAARCETALSAHR